MLTMGKIYETMRQCDETMRMSKMEFFCYFTPANLESAWDLYDRLQETASYRSMFFTGNTARRGLDDRIEKILAELNENLDSYISEITATATTFLESYGRNREDDGFKCCLSLLQSDIQEEPVLNNYVSARKENPDAYADILCVLYLYALTLWKKTAF